MTTATECSVDWMRILLRQTGTGLWLQTDGSWSASDKSAQDFPNALMAIEQSRYLNKYGLELCYDFVDKSLNFEISIDNELQTSFICT